jgi:hypothetical protein
LGTHEKSLSMVRTREAAAGEAMLNNNGMASMKKSVKASATRSTEEFHAEEQQRQIARKESDNAKNKGAFAWQLHPRRNIPKTSIRF